MDVDRGILMICYSIAQKYGQYMLLTCSQDMIFVMMILVFTINYRDVALVLRDA